jgi:hypothetical protein
MSDYTLYYWPMPFRGQFIRAILAYAGKSWDEPDADVAQVMEAAPDQQPVPFMGPPMLVTEKTGFALAEMPASDLDLLVRYPGSSLYRPALPVPDGDGTQPGHDRLSHHTVAGRRRHHGADRRQAV